MLESTPTPVQLLQLLQRRLRSQEKKGKKIKNRLLILLRFSQMPLQSKEKHQLLPPELRHQLRSSQRQFQLLRAPTLKSRFPNPNQLLRPTKIQQRLRQNQLSNLPQRSLLLQLPRSVPPTEVRRPERRSLPRENQLTPPNRAPLRTPKSLLQSRQSLRSQPLLRTTRRRRKKLTQKLS